MEVKAPQADWYFIEADEALRRLDVPANGLTAAEAERRLTEHGPNADRKSVV